MRAIRSLVLLAAIASAADAVGSLVQSAPPKAAQRRNPFDGDQTAKRAGKKLYARQCASCHGENREGRRNAPPLNRPDIRTAASGNLFWVLTNGSLHRGMPSFAHLPDAQRWQIVTWLQRATP